jgi:hypothetical protein
MPRRQALQIAALVGSVTLVGVLIAYYSRAPYLGGSKSKPIFQTISTRR